MPAATTTTTMLTFLSPTTTNPVDSAQRARLLKSTRKLETLLGATPHVLESDLSAQDSQDSTPTRIEHENPKDRHLYLSSSAISSVTSFTESSKSHESLSTHEQASQDGTKKTHGMWKSMPLRTLVLRLRKVPTIPSLNDGTRQPSPPSSNTIGPALICTKIPTLHPPDAMEPPPSPLFSPEHDPALTPKPSQGKIRLKRMTKLIRTLGENVPPELVFSQKQRKASGEQKSEKEPSSPRSRFLWPIWPRNEVASAEPPLTTPTHDSPEASVQPSTILPVSDSHPSIERKRWRRSASIGSLLARASGPANKSVVVETPPLTPCLSRSTTTIRCQDTTNHRGQSGWNGEWNITDSHLRAMALRNLRC